MDRRAFLTTVAGAGLGVLTASRRSLAADSVIDLAVDRPGAVITPAIYGHFIEHLGGVIYDGLWVGRESKIPNVDGLRRQFVDDMKRLGAPALRWPGGCFADGYHWRDGIGPAASRPRTYNFWESRMPPGMHATETNQFGVHEFMHLCRLVGAEPYLAANVGSGTPREFHDWVSYCNAPSGTERLAAERAANGDAAPFGVKYWGVGNESWGCGGDMKPGEYAEQYRRFVTQFPAYVEPFLIATGPRGHSRDMDLGWTTGFFEAMQGSRSPLHGFSPHFYTDFRSNPMRVADFTAPLEGCSPLTVDLNSQGSGASQFLWTMGDGTTLIGSSVTHTYVNATNADQSFDVGRGGATLVQNPVRVLVRDNRVSHSKSLQPRRFHQAPGVISGRIHEHRAHAVAFGLRAHAIVVILLPMVGQRGRISGL